LDRAHKRGEKKMAFHCDVFRWAENCRGGMAAISVPPMMEAQLGGTTLARVP